MATWKFARRMLTCAALAACLGGGLAQAGDPPAMPPQGSMPPGMGEPIKVVGFGCRLAFRPARRRQVGRDRPAARREGRARRRAEIRQRGRALDPPRLPDRRRGRPDQHLFLRRRGQADRRLRRRGHARPQWRARDAAAAHPERRRAGRRRRRRRDDLRHGRQCRRVAAGLRCRLAPGRREREGRQQPDGPRPRPR